MRIKTKYIGGFTYIEIIISLIITAITTVLIMFVYNETQKKFYDDSMESDIAVYCDRAINEIANLLSASTETIKELPSWSGQRSYQITFMDSDQDGQAYERVITIRLHPEDGFIVKEGNIYVTNTIFNGVLINGGTINFGRSGDGNQFTGKKYYIDEWKIKSLTQDDLFHQLNPSKLNAMSLSSYEISINVIVETKQEGEFGIQDLIKNKSFSTKTFSPAVYLREKSKNTSNSS